MIYSIVQVVPRKESKVHVYFSDGRIKLCDLAPLIQKGGLFNNFCDDSDFVDKCTVMKGALAWGLSGGFDPSHCIDIDPESVYLKGVSVKEPLDFDVA